MNEHLVLEKWHDAWVPATVRYSFVQTAFVCV
jgi:hypothetical protein